MPTKTPKTPKRVTPANAIKIENHKRAQTARNRLKRQTRARSMSRIVWEPREKGRIMSSRVVKNAGFRSLDELAKLTGESRLQLSRWANNRPRRFQLLLMGVLYERASRDMGDLSDDLANL